MKWFVRQAPVLGLAAVLCWAALRVEIAVFSLIFLFGFLNISIRPLVAPFNMLALCAVGWLVSQDLSRKYGVTTKFPGVGAWVVATMIVITLMVVIMIIVLTGA
jgi:hypothetical protein